MRHAEPPEAYQERLQASLVYLESHLDDEFSLTDMAWNACLSPFHFHRIFHKLVGRTPGEHLRRRRLDSAARALLGSDQPVGEIARQFGYISLQGFMRAFRDHFHATPTEYRALGMPLFLEGPIELSLSGNRMAGRFSEPVATRREGRRLVGLSRSGDNNVGANHRLVWQALGRLGDRARERPWYSLDRYVSGPEGDVYEFFVGLELLPDEAPVPGMQILEMPERLEAHVHFTGSCDELWRGEFQRLWCHLLPDHGMRPEAASWKAAPQTPEGARSEVVLQIPLAA